MKETMSVVDDRCWEANAMIIKNIVINQLYNDGKLSAEDADVYESEYMIVHRKPSFFKNLSNWLKNDERERKEFIMVKRLN